MISPSWIAGLGIISAIGKDLDENLESLIIEQAGIDKLKWLSSIHEEDLPEGVLGPGAVAIDTETMGLNPLRDRLCLVQISDGSG